MRQVASLGERLREPVPSCHLPEGDLPQPRLQQRWIPVLGQRPADHERQDDGSIQPGGCFGPFKQEANFLARWLDVPGVDSPCQCCAVWRLTSDSETSRCCTFTKHERVSIRANRNLFVRCQFVVPVGLEVTNKNWDDSQLLSKVRCRSGRSVQNFWMFNRSAGLVTQIPGNSESIRGPIRTA